MYPFDRKDRLEYAIISSIRQGTTLLVLGLPGVGKTAKANSIVDKLIKHNLVPHTFHAHTLILSQCDPSDVNGMPMQSKQLATIKHRDGSTEEIPTLTFAPRDFAVRLNRDGGILIFDELTSGPPAVVATSLRTIQERVMGDFVLDSSKVSMLALANPAEIAANGQDLPAPMANRLCHMTWPDPSEAGMKQFCDDWCTKFPYYWGNPPKLGLEKFNVSEKSWALARSIIAGFHKVHYGKLLDFPTERSKQTGPWPSPRSWTEGSKWLAAVLEDDLQPIEATWMLAGHVGEGCAGEFAQWVRTYDLIDPEEVLAQTIKDKGTKNFQMPKRLDLVFPLMSSIAAAVFGQTTPERFIACWDCLAHVAKQGIKDQAADVAMEMAKYWFANKKSLPIPTTQLLPFRDILMPLGLIPETKGRNGS